MDPKILQTLGKIAGIGGIALGVVFLLLKDLLANKVFQNLPPDQAYSLLRIITVGLFGLGALGIVAWVLAKRPSGPRPAPLHAETGSVLLAGNANANVVANVSGDRNVVHAGTGDINLGITPSEPLGSIHLPREMEYTYTPSSGTPISAVTGAELGDRMIEIADRIDNFLETEHQNITETQIVDDYETQFAPVVTELYDEARRRNFSEDLLDRYYQRPSNLNNIRIVSARLNALGEAIRQYAFRSNGWN